MTFQENISSYSPNMTLAIRSVRQERLYELGWSIPVSFQDVRQAGSLARMAYEQYTLFYPEDQARYDEIRDALGLPSAEHAA